MVTDNAATHGAPQGTPNRTAHLADHDFITEVLAAHAQGDPIEEYLAARDLGITHSQITSHPLDFGHTLSAALAAITAGATVSEVAGLIDRNPDQDPCHYVVMVEYANARTAGANHHEVLSAHAAAISVQHYALARRCGATHKEIVSMSGSDVALYVESLGFATHQERLDCQSAGANLADYLQLRKRGNSHHAAIATVKNSIISAGAKHRLSQYLAE